MRRIISLAAVSIVSSLVLSGCDAGCDFRNVQAGLNNGPEDRCQERKGLQGFGFEATCKSLNATAVPGGCDTTGAVFGCDLGQGVIDWYYPPKTRENAAQECGNDTVIDPP
jgi:hypothetical protein